MRCVNVRLQQRLVNASSSECTLTHYYWHSLPRVDRPAALPPWTTPERISLAVSSLLVRVQAEAGLPVHVLGCGGDWPLSSTDDLDSAPTSSDRDPAGAIEILVRARPPRSAVASPFPIMLWTCHRCQ